MISTIKNIFFVGDKRTIAVKKNIIYSICIRGVSILVAFALVPLTIGYVSQELYGVWLTLSSILAWISFMDIGFTQGLKNKLTEAIAIDNWEHAKALVSTTYFLMIILFVPICVVLEFCIPFVDWCNLLNINTEYQEVVLQSIHVLIAFACLQMIVNVLVSVVAAYQRVAMSSSFTVLGNFLSLIIIYVFTKTCESSLVLLCLTMSAMPVIVTIICTFVLYNSTFKKVKPNLKSINLGLTKDLFGLGYKFFIINVQALVVYQSTNILISHVSSPISVTWYGVAYRYLNVAMMLFQIITAPLWPAYTDAYVKEDYSWMNNVRNKMIKVLIASSLLCVLMAAVSPWVYKLWVGDRVDIPLEMTFLVALYVIAYCWMTLNGTILVGMSKVKVETIVVFIGMLIHIPLSLWLSTFVSCYGVVISMVLLNLLYAITFHYQTHLILNKKAWGVWNS